ncbi:MAG: hypothetical protein HY822_10280 [Acidobacteria bacterium]|nr:hypothetical protein [Acidobacteriota bacterium]
MLHGLLEGLAPEGEARERAFRQMLELVPDDHIALRELSMFRYEAGDAVGAEDLAWRSIRSAPTDWAAYMTLSRQVSGQTALSMGLAELAVRKLLLDEESMKDLGPEPMPFQGPETEDLAKLDKAKQFQFIAGLSYRARELEPADVTTRLRPYRLIQQLQDAPKMDRKLVGALISEGESLVPLLVGILRGWARNFVARKDEDMVRSALALLGEIGSASAIPHVLEFIGVESADLSGAARWAFNRILDQSPEDAAGVIAEIASQLGAVERTAVTNGLLLHPRIDPAGELLERLAENLGPLDEQARAFFFPILLTSMILSRGRAGLQQARAVLERNREVLSRKIRWACKDLIDKLVPHAGAPPPAPEPSPYTVYDVCAGNAVWGEAEKEEDEEEDAPVPEPVLRKDEKLPPVKVRGEFDALRSRIGDFLAEAVPVRESRRAVEKYYGGEERDRDGMPLVDWMIHDWTVPRFGRTVMREFLLRNGAGLSAREREFVESSSRSHVALYEVQQVKPGSGVEVKDLHSGEVCFVHDVSMSKSVVRWDGLLARRVEGERGHEFSGVGVSVPRQQLEAMRHWMDLDWQASGLSWPDYLKRNLPRIRRQPKKLSREWLDGIRLQNNDGDEIQFSKAVYRVLDPLPLIAALQGSAEMHEDEDGARFTWLRGKPGGESNTVLGTIGIQGGELTLECNSKQRFERGKSLLAGLARGALQHVRDEITSQQEMKRQARDKSSKDTSGQDEIPPEVRHELMTEVLERHYAAWPDTALPALGGKTPREAAKTAGGRRELTAILRNAENIEEVRRRAGEPYYDVARLRAELGLKEE